jgi:hypothetical protein
MLKDAVVAYFKEQPHYAWNALVRVAQPPQVGSAETQSNRLSATATADGPESFLRDTSATLLV